MTKKTNSSYWLVAILHFTNFKILKRAFLLARFCYFTAVHYIKLKYAKFTYLIICRKLALITLYIFILILSRYYTMNVTLTCSFSSPDSVCSSEGTESHIVPRLACKFDMTPHPLTLGVSSGQQRSWDEKVKEVDLILNRAGSFLATVEEKTTMTISPRHRKGLTTDWPDWKSSTSSYPTH